MVTNTDLKHYVVDSSVIISYLMVDEKIDPNHEKIIADHLHHKITLTAPLILPFEIGNSLKSGVLSKRLTQLQANELFKEFFNLEIKLKPVRHDLVLKLATSHNLSFYEASYLSLHKSTHYPLLTLDKKLLSAAKI